MGKDEELEETGESQTLDREKDDQIGEEGGREAEEINGGSSWRRSKWIGLIDDQRKRGRRIVVGGYEV